MCFVDEWDTAQGALATPAPQGPAPVVLLPRMVDVYVGHATSAGYK